MLKSFTSLLLSVWCAAAVGASGTKISCGTLAGVRSEAEMKAIPSQGINAVDLTFVAVKPPAKVVDKLLRECAAVAVRRDGSKDILVSGWYRKRATDNPNDDELLHPYSGLKFLSYEAASKTIAVRDLTLKRK